MDEAQALSVLQQARSMIVDNGVIFPQITQENVSIRDDTPVYVSDWGEKEEMLYRPGLVELEKAVFEIMGKEWAAPENGFWLHYDENFKQERPEIWKRSMSKEVKNAATEIIDPTLQGGETVLDEFKTFSETPIIKETSSLELKTPEKRIETKKVEYEIVIDGEEIPDTPIIDLPDDTYLKMPD